MLTLSMLLLIHVGLVAVALFDAPPTTKRLAWTSLVTLLALFAYSFLRLEQASFVRGARVRLIALPVALSAVVANYAFGLLSAFAGAVTLGLLLFASAVSRPNAILTAAGIAIGYVGTALAARFEVIPYEPILEVRFAERWQWDACVLAVLAMYVAAYFSGRMMRREMAHVVQSFERAAREAAYRDALLREAQSAYRHTAGIGAPGRFTDQLLDGYRLGDVIGRGGMGEVYAAERLADGMPAAVKLLRLDFLGDRASVSRFAREARIACSISSPHVVRVLGTSGPDAVFPYIAMERLTGADLGSYLRERGRLPLDETCDLARQLAAGLEAAHEQNVVHRDLKPGNVFRAISDDSPEPVWKVLDFGVSTLSHAEITDGAHALVGTPQYMAPEQARGERDLDERTDVYGLAAIAYRALTGEPPFTGELPGLLRQIADHMPVAPTARAQLPGDVDLVLALGLAKQREARIARASAFAVALVQAARSELDPALRERARKLLAEQPYAA